MVEPAFHEIISTDHGAHVSCVGFDRDYGALNERSLVQDEGCKLFFLVKLLKTDPDNIAGLKNFCRLFELIGIFPFLFAFQQGPGHVVLRNIPDHAAAFNRNEIITHVKHVSEESLAGLYHDIEHPPIALWELEFLESHSTTKPLPLVEGSEPFPQRGNCDSLQINIDGRVHFQSTLVQYVRSVLLLDISPDRVHNMGCNLLLPS